MSRLAFQNVPERIEQLKAHLKTRRGRRDLQAMQRMIDLQKYLVGIATTKSFDELLKNYYALENCRPDRAYLIDDSAFSKLTKMPRATGTFVHPVEYKMKTFDDDPPIKTKHASKEYRDNWDRVFGSPSESAAEVQIHAEACVALTPIEQQVGPHPSRDVGPADPPGVVIGWTCPVCETGTAITQINRDDRSFSCCDAIHTFDEVG